MKRNLLNFILAFLLFPSVGMADTKEIIAEGTYNMGDGETPTIAEERALLNAKRIAVEQAGTYIESYSKVKNFQLTYDEIQVLASGIIEVTILDKKRTVIEDGVKFWVKIKAKVSIHRIDEMAKRVKEKSGVEDYKRLQKAYDKMANDMELLKGQLKEIKSEAENREVKAKITDEEKLFQVKLLMEKGWQHYINDDYDSSIEAYTLAISIKPDYDEAYLKRAAMRGMLGQSEQALEDYNRAITVNPNNPKTYLRRGNAFSGEGQDDRAIEDYNQAIKMDLNFAIAYIRRGDIFFKREQFDRAIKEYNRAIAVAPDNEYAYRCRGDFYLKRGQIELALKDFNRAIAVAPNNADAYCHRGHFYLKRGQIELAVKDFNRAVAIEPHQNLGIYQVIGNFFFGRGDFDRAIKEYSKAIAIAPNIGFLYSKRGRTYVKQGQFGLALKDFDQAIRFNPSPDSLWEIYLERGNMFDKKGQYNKALEDYNRAVGMITVEIEGFKIAGDKGLVIPPNLKKQIDLYESQDYPPPKEMVSSLAESENYPDVAQKVRGYLDKGFSEKGILEGLGYSALGGDKSIYSQFLSKSYPEYARAYFSRGTTYHKLGKFKEAIQDTKTAAQMGNKDAQNWLSKRGISW